MPETPPLRPPPIAVAAQGREDHVDIAGILPEQHVLELQGVFGMAAVAHLAEAGDALVGVDPDDRVVAAADHHRDPQIGDPERRSAASWC